VIHGCDNGEAIRLHVWDFDEGPTNREEELLKTVLPYGQESIYSSTSQKPIPKPTSARTPPTNASLGHAVSSLGLLLRCTPKTESYELGEPLGGVLQKFLRDN